MGKFQDITGHRFGRLKAIECLVRSYRTPEGKLIPTYWQCICDCGETAVARVESLKNGDKKSCGCLRHEIHHGLSGHYLHSTWAGIVTRCTNPNSISYKNYGARGVKMHGAWQADFMSFYNYILGTLGDRPDDTYSLDRLDPLADNYEPGKLRWATALEQNNNATSNLIINFNGRNQTLSQWCAELNLKYQTIHDRIQKLKWDPSVALTTPAPAFLGTNINRKQRGKVLA